MASEGERSAEELAALMKSYNLWAAKVARLQRTAEALEAQIRAREAELQAQEPARPVLPPPVELPLTGLQDRASQLEGELQRAWRQLDEARASAAEWERKTRVLSAHLAEREQALAELRSRLSVPQE